MGRLFAVVLAGFAIVGCEPPDASPLARLPDVFRVDDVGPVPDFSVIPRHDAEPSDAGIEDASDASDASGADEGFAPDGETVDAAAIEPDAAFSNDPPTRSQVVVLSDPEDAWIIWVKGKEVSARRISVDDSLLEAPVTRLSRPVERLVGARRRGGEPIVFLPNGNNDPVRALRIRVEADEESGADVVEIIEEALDIFPPAGALASNTGSANILVVGRDGIDPGAPLRWRAYDRVDGEVPSDTDRTGLEHPAQFVPWRGNGNWVFAYPTGHCIELDANLAIRGRWQCPVTSRGARLVPNNDSDALFFAGEAGDDVALWLATPGATVDPLGGPYDDDRLVVLAQDAYINPDRFHSARESLIFDTAPQAGALDTIWIVRGSQTRLITAEAIAEAGAKIEDVIGIAQLGAGGANVRIVVWNHETGEPDALEVQPDLGPTPPTFIAPNDPPCPAQAEDCGGEDLDCDGSPANALCCPADSAQTKALLSGSVRLTELTVTRDDDMLRIAGLRDNAILLTEQPVGQIATGVGPTLANHQGFDRLIAMSSAADRTVIVANHTEPGGARRTDALWQDGTGELQPSNNEAPCDLVHAVQLHIDGRTARFYCSNGAIDQPFADPIAGNGEYVEYPRDGVHWMIRQPTGGEGPLDPIVADLWVAVGPGAELEHWIESSAGIELSDDGLPPEYEQIAGDAIERSFPISPPTAPGARPARIGDGGRLEVHLPGLGWMPTVSSRWILESETSLSSRSPIAITVGHKLNPESRAPEQQVLAYFVHDLRPGGDWWGRELDVGFNAGQPLTTYHSVTTGAYDGSPQLLRAGADAGGNTGVWGFSVFCR